MGSRVGWIGLALAVIVATTWWLLERTAFTPAVAPSIASASTHVPDAEGRTSVSSRTADSTSMESPNRGAGAGDTLAVDGRVGLSGTWVLTGSVLDAATRAPCPGFRVLGLPRIDAHCDADGRFEVVLDSTQDPLGCVRVLHVYDTSSLRVASTSCPLAPDLTLLVEPRPMLRGRVVDPTGRPVSAQFVDVHAPYALLAGAQMDGAEGRFEAPAPEGGIRSKMLELRFTLDSSTFAAVCPTADLLRPEGATVVLDLCNVGMRLRTSDGKPVRFAELWMERRRANADTVSTYLELRADVDGLVEVTLERDLVDLWVQMTPLEWLSDASSDRPRFLRSLGGHTPWTERLSAPPCDSIWDIPFHRLGPEDVVSGRVLLPDGSPAQGAGVVCWAEGKWSISRVTGSSRASTGADGSFSLPWPHGRPVRLRGGSDALSWSRDLAAVGGDRDVEVRLDPAQQVSVRVVDDDDPWPYEKEQGLSHDLILEDGRVRSGGGINAEFTMEHVPPGRHRLGVRAIFPPRSGWVEFEVVEGSPTHVEVRLRRNSHAAGTVIDSAGTPLHGVLVRPVGANWPTDSTYSPLVARTDVCGHFSIEHAPAEAADLELSLEGRAPVRVPLQSGARPTYTLP